MLFLSMQEAINTHNDNEPVTRSYGGMDDGLRYPYSGATSFPASPFSSQSFGGYESSSLGDYGTFRH